MKVIKKFDVKSLGVNYGAMMAAFGFIVGAIYAVVFILGGLFSSSVSNGNQGNFFGAFGLIGGALALVFIPLIYGLMGFVMGILMGAVWNFVVGKTGGLKVEIEDMPMTTPTQA